MIELDSKYQLKDLPKLFGEWMMWFVIVGVVSYLSISVIGLLVMIGGFSYLALYKPKMFVKATVMYLMINQMFALEQVYSGWGEFGGYGQGILYLGGIRRVPPDAPGPSNLYRVLWLAMVLVLLPRYLRSNSKFSFDRFGVLFVLFVLCWLLSAVVNQAFGKTSFRFIIQFTVPFLLFMFFRGMRNQFTPGERASAFAIIMFAGVEMQVVGSLLQNFHKLPGTFFFNDFAVGTFVFPLYERSAYFLSIGFFFFLYQFLISRKPVYIVRMAIALYGILSISVILYTAVFALILVSSLFYASTLKVIKFKELMLAIFVMLLLAYPTYIIFTDESLASDSSVHAEKLIEKNENREWWEVPKIYSYVNLYNMMYEEGRFFFGSGPGTFLTRFAAGEIFEKYRTFTVYGTTQLSSSEFLENSTVGIIGEIGLQGYIIYILLFATMIRRSFVLIKYKRIWLGRADAFSAAILFSGLLFLIFGMVRNIFELYDLTLFYVAAMEIGFRHADHEIRDAIDRHQTQRDEPDEPANKVLEGAVA
ncbi:MAG: hypothetical protein MRZ79_24520 [Bacteroidia bacterium]|nr:hypothetical protein [Bacteroidia bacterium]